MQTQVSQILELKTVLCICMCMYVFIYKYKIDYIFNVKSDFQILGTEFLNAYLLASCTLTRTLASQPLHWSFALCFVCG